MTSCIQRRWRGSSQIESLRPSKQFRHGRSLFWMDKLAVEIPGEESSHLWWHRDSDRRQSPAIGIGWFLDFVSRCLKMGSRTVSLRSIWNMSRDRIWLSRCGDSLLLLRVLKCPVAWSFQSNELGPRRLHRENDDFSPRSCRGRGGGISPSRH